MNSGTLAPGNSIGTLTISGNYTHNAGAVYQVEVNAAGQSDKLVVTGTATLNGGTVSVLAESGNYNLSTTYTILTAGSVVGTFGNVTSNLAFLTPSLTYDPTKVYLTLLRNSTGFPDVTATSNQYTVASALDRIAPVATGDMADVMTTLLGFSAPSARGAFDEMGGLTHTALTGATLSSFRGYMNALSGRMGGFITGGPRSSFANGPVMLASRTDTGSDAGNTLMAALSNAAGRTGTSRGLWAEGYGSLGRRRGNDISSRYDSDMAGFAAGFDKMVTPSLLIGASPGYSHTKVDMKDLSDSATVSSYQGSLYGIYKVNPFYLSGIAACGYNRYDTRRDIAFGTVSRGAKAAYAGGTVGERLEGGYRITTPAADIIPLASLTGIYLMRDGFTERNAGALSLNADSDTTSSLVGSLGVRLTKDYKISSSDTLTPGLKVAWDHEFADGDYALDAFFAGYPASTFTVRGDRPHRDSLGAGFYLTWQTKENISLHLTYDGSFSGDNTQHAGTLGLRYRW